MTPIRHFRLAYETYRHAICLRTDEVRLQRLDDDTENWVDLLRFGADCSVWDAATGLIIGRFSTERGFEGENWVFTYADGWTHICEDTLGAESLIDSEVTISKQWLQQWAA